MKCHEPPPFRSFLLIRSSVNFNNIWINLNYFVPHGCTQDQFIDGLISYQGGRLNDQRCEMPQSPDTGSPPALPCRKTPKITLIRAETSPNLPTKSVSIPTRQLYARPSGYTRTLAVIPAP